MDLIDEEDSWDELGDAVIDVSIDDFIDFESKLLSNFSLLGSVDLRHEAHKVMTSLRSSVSAVEIVKGDILHNLLLLVYITLRDGNVLLSLKIILGGVGIGSADSLDGTAGGLDVDDIADSDLLLLKVLVDAWVKLKLLLTLGSLEADDNSLDDLAVSSVGIFLLLGSNFCHFSFPNFLGLLDSEADGATEVLHEDLGLLDLRGVDLGSDHGAEGHLGSKLGCDGEGDSCLTCAWGTGKEKGFASHLLVFDHIDDDSSGFSGLSLAAETGLDGDSGASLVEAEALDVRMGGDSLCSGRGSYFFDLHNLFSFFCF